MPIVPTSYVLYNIIYNRSKHKLLSSSTVATHEDIPQNKTITVGCFDDMHHDWNAVCVIHLHEISISLHIITAWRQCNMWYVIVLSPPRREWNATGICLYINIANNAQCVARRAPIYAAMRMVAGSRPGLVIVWEWHIGLALLCGCSGALEYPTTNSYGPINKSLSLSLKWHIHMC